MPTIEIAEGPLKGWQRWRQRDEGRFSDLIGHIYFRRRTDGVTEFRSETARAHSNMQDRLYGGYIMAFIDQALFAIAAPHLVTHRGVTLTCNTEFLGAGLPGEDIFGHGEVTRETGKLLFLRGMVEQNGPVASFSGVLRKVAPR
jgi:acyl-coenzyme A thioesterase PaaI-like protein